MKESEAEYQVKMDVYSGMCYFVAEHLHMRPNDILDNWGVPELIIAYGYYTNEIASRNYNEWKQLDPKTRASVPKPEQYSIKFYTPDKLEE